jgi:AAA+ ATPase superfamily predicted ATPase
LGGIPKYLEEIRQTQSFEANIEALCFKSDGFLFNEVDKIFFSQFKEARTYKKIVNKIGTGIVSLDEIARHLKMPSGGGVKEYLTNLELAGMIKRFKPLHETSQKMTRYKLSDEFLIFFLKYIAPVTHRILAAPGTKYFKKQVLPVWQPWLGFAFENFCQKYAMNIASAAGFADEVIDFGPYFSFAEQKGFQIDLIYERTGGVLTVCEIKYLEAPVATSVIPELERKIALLPKKRGITVEKMLIAPQGASTALLESKYFHHVVTLDELLFPNC